MLTLSRHASVPLPTAVRRTRGTLDLMALGLSNAEICESTGLSIGVVKGHVREGHALAGTRRRTDLASWVRATAGSSA
jgi:DNA-binding NarL/FixJ family response regulator